MVISSSRVKNYLVLLLFLTFALFATRHWLSPPVFRTKYSLPPLHYIFRRPVIDTTAQIRFWKALEFALTSNGPGIGRPTQHGKVPEIRYNANEDQAFDEKIEMSSDDVDKMRRAHENFMKAISVHRLEPVYNPGTRGIVCSAGGSYLPLIAVTLRILQKHGSNLPMEVFVRSGDEYESYICDKVFPILNARCVILSEILDAAPHPVDIRGFQLKIFALLFSSFEEVLFLDADSLPLQDPASFFDSEPYVSRGMILWPDFWYVTPSKYFFEISGLDRPKNSLRASTESGQFLVSKKSHWKTLLVAAYYNYWGPEHYYPLLTQGGAGEGDKETFLAAARVAKQSFYDVSEKVLELGNEDPDYPSQMLGTAMVQFDPVEDHRLTSSGIWRTKNPKAAAHPKPVFIHINLLKFNPGRVYDDTLIMRWPNGSYRRAWTKEPETVALFGSDVERMYWQESKVVACELEHVFRDWYGKEDICTKATNHWNALFETS
jgi:alpha 1,2-mannosyltransferase